MADVQIRWQAVMIDCKEHVKLAQFYARLLNWTVVFAAEDYAGIAPYGTPYGGYPGISFQRNPDYVPPVWPEQEGRQQTMEHLDLAVDDLDAAVAHALACGATKAELQYSPTEWIVMLDPEGHPFCLCLNNQMLNSPDCALK